MSIFDRLGLEFSSLSVLLVEDNEFARNVARTALWQIGFTQIHMAKNGSEAMELLRGHDVNVIVSDWNMPVVSGLDLLREARKRWPGIPFVMVTGNDSEEEVGEARKEGVDAYIIKPFSLDILRERIVFAFRRRLARGGDMAGGLEESYLEVLDQLENVTRVVGGSNIEALRSELKDFQQSVEHLLFNPENRELHLQAFVANAKAVKAAAGEGAELVEPLVDQMTEFVESMGAPNPVQLEVVKLHIEAMDAVMEGRVRKQLDGTRLLQTLQKAVEMAEEEWDPLAPV